MLVNTHIIMDPQDTEMYRSGLYSTSLGQPFPELVFSVQVFEALKDIFGDDMPSYLVVVFSRRDELEKQGVSFEEQVKIAFTIFSRVRFRVYECIWRWLTKF